MMLKTIKKATFKKGEKKGRTEKGNKKNIPRSAACTIFHHSWKRMANLSFLYNSVLLNCCRISDLPEYPLLH